MKLTKKQVQQEIERRNKLFENASNAEKRVLIAKDVIDQIKKGKFIAETGKWVGADHLFEEDSSAPLRESFLVHSEPCRTCALGGLMMSCVLFNNNETIGDLFGEEFLDLGWNIRHDHSFKNGLSEIFDRDQLILIEKYFEGGDGYFHDSDQRIDDFYEEYLDNDQERLLAIIQNIVDNGGEFVPEKLNYGCVVPV